MMIKVAIIVTLDFEFESFDSLLSQKVKKIESFDYGNSLQGKRYLINDLDIYLIQNDAPGLVQASITTTNVINKINPKYLILCGVAAGLSNKNVKIGDIIIPNQILDFSNQKQINDEILYKSKIYKPSKWLIDKARKISKSNWREIIINSNIRNNSKNLNVHFGTIASSDRIITNIDQINSLINTNRDIIGIEMESGGFAAAIQNSDINIEFIIIRSVSDLLTEKNENSNVFASTVVAAFSIELIFKEISNSDNQNKNDAKDQNKNDDFYSNDFETGKGTFLKREMNLNRAYLNSEAYAQAISEILNESQGEICFALLGHWGRGKTYLMQLVEQRLNQTYECIWFSAWKYKSKPELWVHLYEIFREHVSNINFFRRIPLIFQGKYLQFGFWPILLMIVSLSIGLIPFGSVILYILGLFGIIGFIKFLKLFSIGKNKISGFQKFVFLNKFSEKLGLQALLGKELKYLLLGLFNKIDFKSKNFIFGIFLYLGSIGLFNLILFWSLNNGNPIDAWSRDLGIALYPSNQVLKIIALIVSLISLLVPLWFFCITNKKKKALLIIDDLDRITPNEMLDIIESLKLFLEDKKINDVLQVVMIFEKSSLEIALLNKYSLLINDSNGISNRECILRENMQKLFIAHLTLPPLNFTEYEKYAIDFLDFSDLENNETSAKNPDIKFNPLNFEAKKKDIIKLDGNSTSVAKQINIKPDELTYFEKKAIIKSLKYFNESENNHFNVGPRLIQSYIIKYKLVRKLLEARNQNGIHPELITSLIAKKMINPLIELEMAKNLSKEASLSLKEVIEEIS